MQNRAPQLKKQGYTSTEKRSFRRSLRETLKSRLNYKTNSLVVSTTKSNTYKHFFDAREKFIRLFFFCVEYFDQPFNFLKHEVEDNSSIHILGPI